MLAILQTLHRLHRLPELVGILLALTACNDEDAQKKISAQETRIAKLETALADLESRLPKPPPLNPILGRWQLELIVKDKSTGSPLADSNYEYAWLARGPWKARGSREFEFAAD